MIFNQPVKFVRSHVCLPLICLLFILVSSSYTKHLDSPAPTSSAVLSRGALWTNTFPSIQNNGAALRFLHYGLEEGLSQSSVQVILQDSFGFLWIGTQDGLDRFDSYGFKVFRPNPNDPNALIGGEILSISQGIDGTLWIGTNAGLNRYDPTTGKFMHWVHEDSKPDSLIDDTVLSVYQDSQGVLFVGTHKGLDQFDPTSGKFAHLHMPDKPLGDVDSINTLYEDEHHTLWIGTDDGLIRYSISDQQFQRYRNQIGDGSTLSFDEVSSISEDQSGALWIGTHFGLNRLNPSDGKFVRFGHSDSNPGSLSEDYVRVTYVDREGELWIGTANGLDRFNPVTQEFAHYRSDPADPTSLSSNTIDAVYEDRGGILWIGTDDEGLNEHDRGQDKFAYYHHVNADPASLSGDTIFPIAPSLSGQIWIGTYHDGLNLFDPTTGQSKHFRHDPSNPDSLLDDTVLSLFLDKSGTLWIGTSRGLDALYPGNSRFVHYVNSVEDQNSIPFGSVYTVYQDNQLTYWVGTTQGARIFNPFTGEFTKVEANGADPAELADGRVRAIYQDRSGSIWFGTDIHGLFRLNPITRQLEQYTNNPVVKNSLSSNSVMDIYEDSRGIIWVATFGGGLDRYLPGENGFVQYQQEQGLPNDVVYGILEDQDGNLWLSTNLGLSKFIVSSSVFHNFTVQDGLQSNEFDSSAFAEDSAGRMYFGGVNGLTVFNPLQIQTDSYVPPLALTSLTTQDGQPLVPTETAETLQDVKLIYPQDSFDMSFTALSFSQIGKNQYKYMLQGFDRTWHNIGFAHQGSYTNLPGGSYTLHILGSNSDGIWNDVGTTLRVTVVPPFWQTWIFQGLAGIVLILAALLVYRSRVRGIHAQKIELEHMVLDRTQALKKRNLDLEALYSADEKMLRVLTQDEALQALVDVAVDVLQADKSAVFTRAANNSEYTVRVSRGFRRETVESPEFPKSQQPILLKIAAGEPLIIIDVLEDPKWNHQPDEIIDKMPTEGVRSLMYIPVKVQNTVLGVFNVCSSSPSAFNEDRQRLFVSLVQRAALSIENSNLFEQNKRVAILEERNRLAQELHDSAKQKAFAALAQLGAAKKLANHDDRISATEHLAEAENIVSEVIHDLTFFIQESYPSALKEKGLASFLRDYALAWESRSEIKLNLSILGERRLNPRVEQILYRVVQEGLSNIARHSQAKQANIQITYQAHEIHILLIDNGKGFDLSKAVDGLGLQLTHERLESVGGQIEIESRRGGGTTITVRAPI